jgi:hypothetical protein
MFRRRIRPGILDSVKRAIFRRENIQVNQDLLVVSTPIGPEALAFEGGEEMVVALPRASTVGVGEYQFLYRIQDYLGEDPERASSVFKRPAWRYFYGLESIAAIRPFSLEDVMVASGGRDEVIWERYHGQTQHHRIIRTIETEDEPVFRSLIAVASEPVPSIAGQVEANQAAAEFRAARERTRDEIIRRLRTLDRQNREAGGGKQRRAALRQKRSREFVALLRALYGRPLPGLRETPVQSRRSAGNQPGSPSQSVGRRPLRPSGQCHLPLPERPCSVQPRQAAVDRHSPRDLAVRSVGSE